MNLYLLIQDEKIIDTFQTDDMFPARAACDYRDEHHPNATLAIVLGHEKPSLIERNTGYLPWHLLS